MVEITQTLIKSYIIKAHSIFLKSLKIKLLANIITAHLLITLILK